VESSSSATASTSFVVDFGSSSGIVLPSSLTCTKGSGFKKNPTCTRTSDTQFTVVGASSQLDLTFSPIYTFTIANLQNPSSAKVISTATVKSYNSATLIYTDTLTSFTYTAITIDSCTLSSSLTTVGATATVSLKCDLESAVPSGGIIYFSAPKWVGTSYGATIPVSMLDSLSDCNAASDIIGNAPTCDTDIDTSSSATTDYITITNAFSTTGGASAGDTVEIQFVDFVNPPSTLALSGFEVKFQDSSGNDINIMSGISLTVTQANDLSSSTFVQL